MKIFGILFSLLLSNMLLNAKDMTSNIANIKVHFSQTEYYFNEYFILSDFMNENTIRLSIEANYVISKYFDAGLYIASSTYKKYIQTDNESMGELSSKPLLFYGISGNLHLLPLLINENNFWADLYLSCNFGTINYVGAKFPSNSNYKPFDYGIYGGLALFPGRNWGFFYEHGIGNYFNNRFGINLRF